MFGCFFESEQTNLLRGGGWASQGIPDSVPVSTELSSLIFFFSETVGAMAGLPHLGMNHPMHQECQEVSVKFSA